MDFTKMDTNTIATGVTGDGVKYLQLFLTEYTKLFPGTVNPSCNKCLNDYVTKYKKAMSTDKFHHENYSGYKLKAMYENIPLEFGSQILVNNTNLTDEFAQILLSHDDGERFFVTPLPERAELTGREKLQAEYNAAEKVLNELPEKVHHAKKKKAETTFEAAKEALEQYDAEHPAEEDDIQIVLTDEDIEKTEGLSEAGFKAGDAVTVDKKEYTENGVIHVTGTGKPE